MIHIILCRVAFVTYFSAFYKNASLYVEHAPCFRARACIAIVSHFSSCPKLNANLHQLLISYAECVIAIEGQVCFKASACVENKHDSPYSKARNPAQLALQVHLTLTSKDIPLNQLAYALVLQVASCTRRLGSTPGHFLFYKQ